MGRAGGKITAGFDNLFPASRGYLSLDQALSLGDLSRTKDGVSFDYLGEEAIVIFDRVQLIRALAIPGEPGYLFCLSADGKPQNTSLHVKQYASSLALTKAACLAAYARPWLAQAIKGPRRAELAAAHIAKGGKAESFMGVQVEFVIPQRYYLRRMLADAEDFVLARNPIDYHGLTVKDYQPYINYLLVGGYLAELSDRYMATDEGKLLHAAMQKGNLLIAPQ